MNKSTIRIFCILILFVSGLFALAQDVGITPTAPSISICGDGIFTVTVANEGATPITNVVVEATVPGDYSFRGTTGSSSWSDPTVTWSTFDLAVNDGAPGGLDEWSETITISPDCDAINGRELIITVNWDGGGPETATSGPIQALDPYMVIEVLPLVQSRAVGETASWNVRVKNNGLGDLYNVVLNASLGAGMANLSPAGWPMSIGDIASGDVYDVGVVTADVDSCEDIYVTFVGSYNGCGEGGDVVCGSTIVEGGVELDYHTPNLAYTFTPGNIDIPYCDSQVITVDLTNSGADAGDINDLVMEAVFPPQVNLLAVSGDATYDPANEWFDVGDVAANETRSFTFELEWADKCSPVDCETIIFEPHFTDGCGEDFYPPVEELPVVDPPVRPYFSVSKVKDTPGILNQGESDDFIITVTFNAPAGISTTADIEDSFPANFTALSASGGGVIDNGARTVTWSGESFNSGDTNTYTVELRADTFSGSDCTISENNTVTVTNITDVCDDCAILDASSSLNLIPDAVLTVTKSGPNSIYVNSASETYTIEVTYDGPLCDFGSGLQTPPVTVTDTLPGGTVISNPSPSATSVDNINHIISWYIPAGTLTQGVPYSLLYDVAISSSAPGYDVCMCGTVVSNSVYAELDDGACIICDDSASVGIGVECDDELASPIRTSKTASPDTQELCECIDYTNTIIFDQALSWADIDFTENGDNGQLFSGGGLSGDAIFTFTQGGSTYTATETITVGTA
jgi:uncharacterized repeat protein (TIGR01451 family)